METTKILAEIKNGETFKIADIEFIKFSDIDGVACAATKNILFNSVFGSNNNLAESLIIKKLERDILPKIEAAIGAENVVEFETDLLSLDGSDKYGKMKSKISLPTFDFYRANVKIFDEYKVNKWWWLATPDSTTDHTNDFWITCVSPLGYFIYYGYDNFNFGVRPILNFVSSISVSCKE